MAKHKAIYKQLPGRFCRGAAAWSVGLVGGATAPPGEEEIGRAPVPESPPDCLKSGGIPSTAARRPPAPIARSHAGFEQSAPLRRSGMVRKGSSVRVRHWASASGHGMSLSSGGWWRRSMRRGSGSAMAGRNRTPGSFSPYGSAPGGPRISIWCSAATAVRVAGSTSSSAATARRTARSPPGCSRRASGRAARRLDRCGEPRPGPSTKSPGRQSISSPGR